MGSLLPEAPTGLVVAVLASDWKEKPGEACGNFVLLGQRETLAQVGLKVCFAFILLWKCLSTCVFYFPFTTL